MIPYGTMHHVYIHARWTWPTFTRAKAPVMWRSLFRMGRAVKSRTPLCRRRMPPPVGHALALGLAIPRTVPAAARNR
ncbi:hypothetical protein [Poseidonocella sp. HB161398]|uniref:hypothetical protein n=1 Tax=Poseidonocella sp. HB161398 TaxID=2320855 RepID=UPI0011099668|nr:hypothetical protein [Poseidonocella sp. HB161398]